ncbi:hypothetical protein PGTUg99_008845 [Puccinia graminis f. sp. tritici]|uniref:Uncharacterized protein n=1 Tax=Puccinia graminis f. sp. tritici TaxID=56615 RepID=A0A5B0RAY6_PUCGR|nr:hypothetical protein PGTUg99_008845 [Puccinia graminis f. sp. tritici]
MIGKSPSRSGTSFPREEELPRCLPGSPSAPSSSGWLTSSPPAHSPSASIASPVISSTPGSPRAISSIISRTFTLSNSEMNPNSGRQVLRKGKGSRIGRPTRMRGPRKRGNGRSRRGWPRRHSSRRASSSRLRVGRFPN